MANPFQIKLKSLPRRVENIIMENRLKLEIWRRNYTIDTLDKIDSKYIFIYIIRERERINFMVDELVITYIVYKVYQFIFLLVRRVMQTPTGYRGGGLIGKF